MKYTETILLTRLCVQAGRSLPSQEVKKVMRHAETASRRTLSLACEALTSRHVDTSDSLWDVVAEIEAKHRISHFARTLSDVMRKHHVNLPKMHAERFEQILEESLQIAEFELAERQRFESKIES